MDLSSLTARPTYRLRSGKRWNAIFTGIISVLLLLALPVDAQIENSMATSYTDMHAVSIKGYQLPSLFGKKLNELSLMRYNGESMEAIPFQFDEFDESGLVFIDGLNKYPVDGEKNTLNATDELLFMFRDASLKRLAKNISDKNILAELKVEFKNNKARYVYLVKGNKQVNPVDYTRPFLDETHGGFESKYINIRFNRDNMSLIDNISFNQGKHAGKNIFDSLYFRLSAGFLNKHVRVKLDSHKNIKAQALGFKDGPIRSTFLVEAKAKIAGIPAVTANFNLSFYEQAAKLKSRFAVDKSKLEFFQFASYLAPLLRRPEVYVEFDFVNTEGARFTFESLGHGNTVLVDGSMTGSERKLNEVGLPGNWVCFDSKQEWQMMLSNFLPLAEDGIAQHLLDGTRFYIAYDDNALEQSRRERFPGASPRIVIAAEGFPKVMIALFRAFDMDILNEFDFSRQITIGETNRIIAKIHKQGKLRKIDKIVRQQLVDLRERGIINNNQELVDALLEDMNQLGVEGVDKKQTRFLVTEAMSAIESFETYRTLDIGIAFGKAVQKLGLNPDNIHYQAKDNTLWWARDFGDPAVFYQQLNTPPRVSVRSF